RLWTSGIVNFIVKIGRRTFLGSTLGTKRFVIHASRNRPAVIRPETASLRMTIVAHLTQRARGRRTPRRVGALTQEMIGRAINESFGHAFRLIMAIGATLALASALIALIRSEERRVGKER